MTNNLQSLRRIFHSFAFLALTIVLSSTLPVSAQVEIPADAITSQTELLSVIQEGEKLEREGRWGEALSYYEGAVRENPNHADLKQRLTSAQIHFDLGRRYHDSSYVTSLDEMDERRALDIYTEILLKIQAHHVNGPNWQELVRRGTANVDVALTEADFLSRNKVNADPDRVTAVRRELHRVLDPRVPNNRNDARELVSWAARYVKHQLGVANQAVVMEYTCGAIGALDMYSSFLTGDQLDDVMSQIEGNFVGMGIELKSDNDALLIVTVIPGGPAERAGIKGGDRIIEVAGKSTKDITTDAAADMLRGDEGTSVEVTVVNADEIPRRLRVRRERVEVPSVEDVKIIDPEFGIGYLKLTSFQKTTLRDFDAALWNLHGQGMKSLIVDVRGNPGGLLTASVEVADKFVSSGTIVSTRGRSAREDFDYKAHVTGTWRVPLIVLIDGDSASASEIFAGAIHDHRRGTVVGVRSFGKGSVQGIFPLNISNAGVRLTTAKFYSPSGQAISHQGVQPDVVVRTTAKPTTGDTNPTVETDAILNAGLQVARQQLSQR